LLNIFSLTNTTAAGFPLSKDSLKEVKKKHQIYS